MNPFTSQTELEHFCKTYGINYLAMFGSYARGNAHKNSDIDLLVQFDPAQKISLFKLNQIQGELQNTLGREVDLVTQLNEHIAPYIQDDLIELYPVT